ncbi:MAG: flagellar FliJ family protein [Acetobacterales bacterium]
MTKTLHALIRLRRHQVDEKRRELAALYGEAARLEAKREALQDELAREQDAAAGEALLGFTYAAYGTRTIQRRKALQREVAALEGRIEQAQVRVADAFRDAKSLEQVQEARDREAAQERKRLEQAELDELAAQKHARGGGF